MATRKKAGAAQTPKASPGTSRTPAARKRRSSRTARAEPIAVTPGTSHTAASIESAVASLQELTARLTGQGAALGTALLEIPKAADFQPLADHLYEFAAGAPRLTEALQEVPKATEAIRESTEVLSQVSETLQLTQERFGESLMQLPRAEDYEPLAAPLREFARVAPSLADALAEVVRVARPLAESAQGLRELGDSLRGALAASQEKPAQVIGASSGPLAEAVAGLRDAAERFAAGREAVVEALATLPRDPAYGPVARQLRELATVSPSLLAWLEEVPRLATPLAGSVDALERAARELDQGCQAALECLNRIQPTEAPLVDWRAASGTKKT